MPQVTVIQRVLPHYRIPFLIGLHESLAATGISLKLVYGQELPGTVPRTEKLHQPWARQIVNRYTGIFGSELVWQPCLEEAAASDLVIVEQANRLLVNYLLRWSRYRGRIKLAYFGHGRNFQARKSGLWREYFKQRISGGVDWWFAYTDLTGDLVAASGFPADRITVVQNAIDTSWIHERLTTVRQQDLAALRAELGLAGENVAVFCGGMHADKRLDFLLETCLALRNSLPDFEMIFIGSGPEQYRVEQAAQRYPWIHYVGPRFGDRVPYLKLGKALLMPGLVGLAVVDSFSVEVPLFTTDIPFHSPEIAYLENGTNGIMTDNSMESYAAAVVDFFRSADRQRHLRDGCRSSAKRYSLENMIANFTDGIKRCLDASPKRKTSFL